ncbi:hypothetical protein C8J57DRAFT_1512497 [Mycena rebaudengoi]|nr:hypothetical protein C8J57DRAFT_1512497 [Mycena rebaudengoi]
MDPTSSLHRLSTAQLPASVLAGLCGRHPILLADRSRPRLGHCACHAQRGAATAMKRTPRVGTHSLRLSPRANKRIRMRVWVAATPAGGGMNAVGKDDRADVYAQGPTTITEATSTDPIQSGA